MSVLPIASYDFFWRSSAGNVNGFKNGLLEPVKIEIDKEGVLSEIKPKDFFTIDGVIYFSVDIPEINPDFNPDYVYEEGEELIPQYILVEKYVSQAKDSAPVEIQALPDKPEADHLVMNDGIYKIETSDYNDIPVSDIFRIAEDKFCGRNIKVSGYYYGFLQDPDNTGAFLDIQDGSPNTRKPGLYFINDRFTSQMKIQEAGRMWVF